MSGSAMLTTTQLITLCVRIIVRSLGNCQAPMWVTRVFIKLIYSTVHIFFPHITSRWSIQERIHTPSSPCFRVRAATNAPIDCAERSLAECLKPFVQASIRLSMPRPLTAASCLRRWQGPKPRSRRAAM